MTTSNAPVVPASGMLCRRALKEGAAWIGALQLPPEFVPVENVAYAMLLEGDRMRVLPVALDEGIEGQDGLRRLPDTSHGIGDLICRPIWPRPADPRVVPVRFLTAFPEANIWSVYGPSPFPLADDAPGHLWLSVNNGSVSEREPPLDAQGMGFSQILTVEPIWDGPNGQRYTLPQTPLPWRAHWLAYHELLADAAHDDAAFANLRTTVARHPVFAQFNYGPIDRTFCRYLAQLREEGLLTEDRPETADTKARKEAVLNAVLASPEPEARAKRVKP